MISTAAVHPHVQAPLWPWALLILLVASGISLSRPRLTSLRLTIGLPMVLAIVSLAGVRSAFGLGPVPLGAWLAGLAGGAALVIALGWPGGVVWRAEARRVLVPGSWVPLALFLGIFASRFAVGAITAMKLPVLDEVWFAPTLSALYGVFSGVLLGRALTIWRAVPVPDTRLLDQDDLTPVQPRP